MEQPIDEASQPAAGVQMVNYATPLGFGGPLLANGAAKFSLICGVGFFVILVMGLLANIGRATHEAVFLLLVLGILAPLLAVIFGIIGFARTRDGRHCGKGLAITGISLGGVGLLLAIIAMGIEVLSPPMSSRATANPVKCRANLMQIGLAMQLYANENKGQFPPRPEDLILTQDITPEIFICPSTNDTLAPGATPQQQAANLSAGGHHSYIYLGAGKNSSVASTVILVYESPSNHKGRFNALYGDGHVEFLTGAISQKTLSELQAGYNPPRSNK